MLFEFPSKDDWQKLVATFPFHELIVRVDDIRILDNVGDDIDGVYARWNFRIGLDICDIELMIYAKVM